MEVPIQEADQKVIERFDHFIKTKLQELEVLKNELKTLHNKLVTEYRGVEGGVY